MQVGQNLALQSQAEISMEISTLDPPELNISCILVYFSNAVSTLGGDVSGKRSSSHGTHFHEVQSGNTKCWEH